MRLPTLTKNPNWIRMHTTRKGYKKMYKAKKQWVIAGIALLSLGGISLINNANANANNITTVNRSADSASNNTGNSTNMSNITALSKNTNVSNDSSNAKAKTNNNSHILNKDTDLNKTKANNINLDGADTSNINKITLNKSSNNGIGNLDTSNKFNNSTNNYRSINTDKNTRDNSYVNNLSDRVNNSNRRLDLINHNSNVMTTKLIADNMNKHLDIPYVNRPNKYIKNSGLINFYAFITNSIEIEYPYNIKGGQFVMKNYARITDPKLSSLISYNDSKKVAKSYKLYSETTKEIAQLIDKDYSSYIPKGFEVCEDSDDKNYFGTMLSIDSSNNNRLWSVFIVPKPKPKYNYVAEFTYQGTPVSSDDLGQQTEGYSTTVSQIEGDVPSGYKLSGMSSSSPLSFSQRGKSYVADVPVKKIASPDYEVFSDSSDGYVSSKIPIGEHSDAFVFRADDTSQLDSDYKLANPDFSKQEPGVTSVTVHVPVTRKVYTVQLPVNINLESDGSVNDLAPGKISTETPRVQLKVGPGSGSSRVINITGSSDTDDKNHIFMQPKYTPSRDHSNDNSYTIRIKPHTGGQPVITPNPDGNNTLEFYETPVLDHINTMYVDSDGNQIPGSKTKEISGDESVTMDPRDAYHERLKEGGSDIPSGDYLILDDEYKPEQLFSSSSTGNTIKIPVEPYSTSGMQKVEINLEGPNSRQISMNVPWKGARDKDNVIFNASDYVKPYLDHYGLDTGHPTKYTGSIKGNNNLAISPSTSDGAVQFYLKPVPVSVNTRYEDIDTGLMVPGTNVKPINGLSGMTITPAKAVSMRGDSVPSGYQLVPGQNSSYTLNNGLNNPMINIRVESIKANGKTITINRFIRDGNEPFRADGSETISLGELTYGNTSSARISPSDFIPDDYEIDHDKDSRTDNAIVYPVLGKDGSVSPSSLNYYYKSKPATMQVVYKTKDGRIVGVDPNSISGSFNQQIKESDIAKILHVAKNVPQGYTITNPQNDTTYTYGNHRNTATIYVSGVPAKATFRVYVQTKDFPSDSSDYRINPPKLVKQDSISGAYGTKLPEYTASDFLSDVPEGYVLDPNSNNQKVSLYITPEGELDPKSDQVTFHYVAGYSGNDPAVKPATLRYVNVDSGAQVGQTYTINGYMNQTKTVNSMAVNQRNGGKMPKGYQLLPNDQQADKTYTFGTKPGEVTALIKPVPMYGTFTITRWLEHSDKSITKIDTIKKQLTRQPNQNASKVTFNADSYIPNSNLQVDPKQPDDTAPITVYLDPQGNVMPKKSANFYYQSIPAKPVVVKYLDADNGQPMGNAVTVDGHKGEVRSAISLARTAYPEANISSDYTLANAKNSNGNKSHIYSFDNGSGIIYGYVKDYPTRIEIPRVLEYPDGETRRFTSNAEAITHLDRGQKKTYFADAFTPFGYEPDLHKPSAVTVTKGTDGSVISYPEAFYYKAMESNQSGSPVTPITVNYKDRSGKTLTSANLNGFMGESVNAQVEDSVPDNYQIAGGQDLSRTFDQYRNSPVNVYVNPKPVSQTNVSNSDLTTVHSDSDNPEILSDNYTPEKYDEINEVSSAHRAYRHNNNRSYHYRWFMVTKPVKMYRRALHRKAERTISPRRHLTIKILHIYHRHGRVQYQVRYHHHIWYVNAGRKATPNAYYSQRDLRHAKVIHGKRYIRIIARHGDYVHRQTGFKHLKGRKHLRYGKVLPVIGIRYVGSRHNLMTRFILEDGRYITSNKNYVKLIK